MVQSNHETDFLCCFRPFWDHLGTVKWTQKGRQRPASGWDVWPKCLGLKISPNQIIRPILLGEMVQNNQKKRSLYAVFLSFWGHFETPKKTQKGTQRPASGQNVWPNV
jgi:hypothetical protein